METMIPSTACLTFRELRLVLAIVVVAATGSVALRMATSPVGDQAQLVLGGALLGLFAGWLGATKVSVAPPDLVQVGRHRPSARATRAVGAGLVLMVVAGGVAPSIVRPESVGAIAAVASAILIRVSLSRPGD